MVGLLLAGTVPAYAQHEPRFNPPGVGGDHELRFFDHADLSEYGTANRAKTGFFFQYDKLIWAFSSPESMPIGNPAGNRLITVEFPTFPGSSVQFLDINSLNTSFMETEWVQGNRYELGYVDDCTDQGWLFSIAHARQYHQDLLATGVGVTFIDPFNIASNYIDVNGDGVQEDVNGNGIFGNTLPNNVDTDADLVLDAYAGPDAGDLVAQPISFPSVLVRNTTRFTTMEVMHVTRWDPLHSGATVEWLYGLRFMNLTDQFRFIGSGGSTIFNSLEFLNQINNYIIGPQVGIRGNRQIGAWRFGGEARLMAAANFQRVRLDGTFIGATFDVSPNAFDQATTNTEFAPVAELRLDVAYQLTNAISLRAGYTGIAAGGISRASRRVNYTLPALTILDDNKLDSFIINGFNFGVEINR